VAKAMGMDGRIGPKFLHPGPGYGGSCFPKDTKALVAIANDYGEQVSIVKTVIESNEHQKIRMADRVVNALDGVQGKMIGVLGLAFKAETDDVRDSPSLVIVNELIEQGAVIKAYDPEAIPNFKQALGNSSRKVTYCYDAYEVAKDADALVILTEWNEFRQINLLDIKDLMTGDTVFDFRNIFNPDAVRGLGLHYESVGRQ